MLRHAKDARPPDDQILNQSKMCHLLAKVATNASGAIWWPKLQLMQVASSCGQICNLCKWCHLVAKFATNASGAMLLPSLVTESISGSVVPLAMFDQSLNCYKLLLKSGLGIFVMKTFVTVLFGKMAKKNYLNVS